MVACKGKTDLLFVVLWFVVGASYSLKLGTGTASIGPIYISTTSENNGIKVNVTNFGDLQDETNSGDFATATADFGIMDMTTNVAYSTSEKEPNLTTVSNDNLFTDTATTGFTNQPAVWNHIHVYNASYQTITEIRIYSGDGTTQISETSTQMTKQDQFSTTQFEVTTPVVESWTNYFGLEETKSSPSATAMLITDTEKERNMEQNTTTFQPVVTSLDHTSVYLTNRSKNSETTAPLITANYYITQSDAVAAEDFTTSVTRDTFPALLTTANDFAATTSATHKESVSTKDNFDLNHTWYGTTAVPVQVVFRNKTGNTTENQSTEACKNVGHVFARDRFRHKRRIPQKAVIEFKINISQKLGINNNRKSEHCLLIHKLLQASEDPLARLIGRLGYDKEPHFTSGDVVSIKVSLITDFGVGLKNKTNLLHNLYANVISQNLKARGIIVVPGSVNVQLGEIDSSLFCRGRCHSNERCSLVEDRFARWGVCTSNCLNTTYCTNGGICKYNDNGKEQCWCPVTTFWWFRGERCEIAESQVMMAIIAGVCCALVAFLLLSVLICMARKVDRAKRGKTQSWIQSRKNQAIFDLSSKNHSERTGVHQVPLSFPSQVSIGLSTNEEAKSLDDTESLPMRAKWSPQGEGQQLSLGLLRLKQSDQVNSTHGLVQATSFRRINSRERAEMSSLHGEVVEVTNHQEEVDNMTFCNTMV